MSQDRDFETYLQGKTTLSQLYADSPQVKVPDHLDAAILAEAHRAVNARPGARPKRRWTIPLGMAASLFVVVMIGLQLPYMLQDANLPPPMEQRPIEKKASGTTDQVTANPSSPTTEVRKKQHIVDKGKPQITQSKPAVSAAEAYTRQNTSAPAGPAVAAKRLELGEHAVGTGTETYGFAAGNLNAAPQQHAPAAMMAAPEPVQSERTSIEDQADAASLRPEDWLVRIKRLKQEGKLEEAKKNLAEFKKRYPDYPVPEALEIR